MRSPQVVRGLATSPALTPRHRWWAIYLPVFVVSLIVPLVCSPFTASIIPALAGALLGAAALWRFNGGYRAWITDHQQWSVTPWLVYQTAFAISGAVVANLGAAILRWAALGNDRRWVLVALGLVVGGLVPLAQVVRADVRRVTVGAAPEPRLWRRALAWLANVLFVLSATVGPLLLLTWSSRWLLGGLVVALAWLARLKLARRAADDAADDAAAAADHAHRRLVIGSLLVLSPLVASAMLRPTLRVPPPVIYGGLVVFVVGASLLAGAQQGSFPTRCSLSPFGRSSAWFADRLFIASVLVVTGGLMMVLAVRGDGVPLLTLLLAVAVPVLVGAALITRGEGFLAVALVGMLLTWAVKDHAVVDAPPIGSAGDMVYALGDSYMSGEGTQSFITGTDTVGPADYGAGGSNECRQSTNAYLFKLAAGGRFRLAFSACSGAKAMSDEAVEAEFGSTFPDLGDLDLAPARIAAIVDRVRADGAGRNTIIDQLVRAEGAHLAEPDVVVLSLGGNDAGFSQIGKACFMPGSCQAAVDGRSENQLRLAADRVAIALAAVADAYPGTPLAVVAYPQMFGPAIDQCRGQIPFTADEGKGLQRFVDKLNGAVAAAIRKVSSDRPGTSIVHLTATGKAFELSRFCELDDSRPGRVRLREHGAVNALSLRPSFATDLLTRLQPSNWVHNTFHPTAEGHRLMADALNDWFESTCWRPDAPASDCLRAATADPAATPGIGTGDQASVAEATAPPGSCGDLDGYVYCSLVASIRLIALPSAVLVVAGLYLARGVADTDWRRIVRGFIGR